MHSSFFSFFPFSGSTRSFTPTDALELRPPQKACADGRMARMHLEAPWSPLSSPREQLRPGNAAIQWACGKRGRVAILTVLLFLIVLLMAGARHKEVSVPSLSLTYSQVLTRRAELILVLPNHIIKSRPVFYLATTSSAPPFINTDIPPQTLKHCAPT